jgi:hypothetical protein
VESLTSDDQLLRTPHYSLTETHHLTRVTAYNMSFEFSDDVLKLKRRNLKLNLKDEIVLQSYKVCLAYYGITKSMNKIDIPAK